MSLVKKLIVSTIIILNFCASAFSNKSVFIISKHTEPSISQAYKIDGSQIVLQGNVDVSSYSQGYGAVACATWPEKELIFFTFEEAGTIVWSSTKTLQKVGEYTTPMNSCAGIVVDRDKELIYVAYRNFSGGDNLYVYSFDSENNTLIFQDSYLLLDYDENPITTWGLALDETNDFLYVTTVNPWAIVYIYNTSDFSYDHEITVSVGGNLRRSVGIAVDPARGYMYTGCYSGSFGVEHNYIVRTQLSSPYTSINAEINYGGNAAPACGLAVDDATGYIYVTTQLDDFRVYDSSLSSYLDRETNGVDGPAGVAVGGWYKEDVFGLTKENDDSSNSCVQPYESLLGNYLIFNIHWDANSHSDTGVMITDFLPDGIDYYSSDPEGTFDTDTNSVIWSLGSIGSSSSGTIQLTTKVNYWARPGSKLTNIIYMEGDNYRAEASVDVNICSWGGSIIYVDKNATGRNNGTSWEDAYTNLQDGFTGARNCSPNITAIWVADGNYLPTDNPSDYDVTFELIDGVDLIGHFAGFETSPDERNLSNPNYETILDGKIGQDYGQTVSYILTGQDIEDIKIDGFTIKRGAVGLSINNSYAEISNCNFLDNGNGISCTYFSYPYIHNCIFSSNTSSGIDVSTYCSTMMSNCIFDGNDITYYGISSSLNWADIQDCIFKKHTFDGINSSDSTLTLSGCDFLLNANSGLSGNDITLDVYDCNIANSNYGFYVSDSDIYIDQSIFKNNNYNGINIQSQCNLDLIRSIIWNNGSNGIELNYNFSTNIANNWIYKNSGSGISFSYQVSVPEVRNNTIYDNDAYGIWSSHQGADPNIRNCIIYDNGSGGLYKENGTFNKVNFCNLQSYHSGNGNIYSDPCFYAPQEYNLHIKADSDCKDAGDSNGIPLDETDIDGESRIRYDHIDIGADEFYISPADIDQSNTVDFLDYCILANNWMAEDCSYPDWCSGCDLNKSGIVNAGDLELFCADWLWQPAWIYGWMFEIEEQQMMMKQQENMLITEQVPELETMIQAMTQTAITEQDIEDVLNWLDSLWINGYLNNMTEVEFQQFCESVENSPL